jgi:hypothetical protein
MSSSLSVVTFTFRKQNAALQKLVLRQSFAGVGEKATPGDDHFVRFAKVEN